MKAITTYIFLFSLDIVFSQVNVEDFCSSKSVSKSISDTDDFAKDVTLAYNKVASCSSLKAYIEDENASVYKKCCYVRLSYKLKGTTYVRKGCQSIESRVNIDPQIDEYEKQFQETVSSYYNELGQPNVEIKKVEASIDCNSNFIKFSALLILIILLGIN